MNLDEFGRVYIRHVFGPIDQPLLLFCVCKSVYRCATSSEKKRD